MKKVYGSYNFELRVFENCGTEVTAACCYLFVDVPSCDSLLPNLANYVWVINYDKSICFIGSMKTKMRIWI